jgi:hypothetical protein
MVKEKDAPPIDTSSNGARQRSLAVRVSRETHLKPGDFVVISGNPGRDPADHRVRLLQFKRPKDGWAWGCSRPKKSTDLSVGFFATPVKPA